METKFFEVTTLANKRIVCAPDEDSAVAAAKVDTFVRAVDTADVGALILSGAEVMACNQVAKPKRKKSNSGWTPERRQQARERQSEAMRQRWAALKVN